MALALVLQATLEIPWSFAHPNQTQYLSLLMLNVKLTQIVPLDLLVLKTNVSILALSSIHVMSLLFAQWLTQSHSGQ